MDLPPYAPPTGPLVVLHLDLHLLIVDKPAGLLSVSGRTPDLADSVEQRARAAHGHAWAVHRLDMHTSGVLVLALRRSAERDVMAQFAARTVEKTYVARVSGHPPDDGVIDLPLALDPTSPPRNRVDLVAGKPARTRFRVLDRDDGGARLELVPETGRSHQLRVHLLAIGHPILGDPFYGGAPAPRMMLHARTLTLTHPKTGERVTFDAPTPF
jgi:tRNA pseudouridine32 synthase/23S rRNA pseudouridine746 synthase